jgi:hypothetical protein
MPGENMLFLPAILGNPYLRSTFLMPGEAREIKFFSVLDAVVRKNLIGSSRSLFKSAFVMQST